MSQHKSDGAWFLATLPFHLTCRRAPTSQRCRLGGGPPCPVGCYPTSRETSHLCPTRGTEGGSQAALLCGVLPGVSLASHQLREDQRLCLRDSSTTTCLQHGCADQPAAPAASPQGELVLSPPAVHPASHHTTAVLWRLRSEGSFNRAVICSSFLWMQLLITRTHSFL